MVHVFSNCTFYGIRYVFFSDLVDISEVVIYISQKMCININS
jgi:hypothetical protein